MKCTVLVPSCNRVPSALELLGRLLEQEFDGDWEILVIEQSTNASAEDLAKLERLGTESTRPAVRIEVHPPLGVGGARNVGVRSARGDVVVIIDDDDLPASNEWLARHMRNYEDPNCVAVHGGEDKVGGGGAFEKRFPRLAYRWAMSYSFFGTPMAFPGVTRRKERCSYLRGANSSVRRSYALDAGGWRDECANGQEEHDFSFRLRKLMKPGETIVFDPTARIIRRLDIPGGINRRFQKLEREVEGNVRFYFRVLPRHMPVRVAALLPLYPSVIFFRAVGWILDDRSHEPWVARAMALSDLALRFPFVFAKSVVKEIAAPWRA